MSESLDRIDFALVEAMQRDGRMSNKELAALVGLAQSTCLERIRRLRSIGVIRGVYAEVDPRALGVTLQALVSVRLRAHAPDVFDAFYQHVCQLRETLVVYRIAGADDFLLHVGVADSEHLLQFTMRSLTSHPAVDRVQTTLIFDFARAPVVPPTPPGPPVASPPRLG